MMSSRTPGDLGIYGFRNRRDYSYDSLFIANSDAVNEPRLWDILTRAGKRSIVLGVPGTYPPRPLDGAMVSCFLTPSTESQYTYPPMLRREVQRVVGDYRFDCSEFRTENKDDLLRQVYEMTDQHFVLAEHLLRTRPWELFVMVEIGVDRMHHGFWKYMDQQHPKHEPGSRFADAIVDYHRHIDALLARLLGYADDDTAVFVVSDHGAKRMDGGIRVNEWLRREGYLRLQREPEGKASVAELGVDWSRTLAWSEGGYYARVFLNVRGREPQGLIARENYEAVREELAQRLATIPDADGNPLPTRIYKPEDLYQQVNGVAPDLIVLFGDLLWRAVGTVGGSEGMHTFDNDTGPDDANHAQEGMLILAGPNVVPDRRKGMHLLDVAPTALELLGLDVPQAMRGKSLLR
jgi:predicted AlkP superfamily phosphohydrolase/phosphomutase